MSEQTTIDLRWRVAKGGLPLQERHLRSLAPYNLSPPLLAWVRSRIEWAIDNMLARDTNAVLCLAINPAEDVVLSLDDVRPAPPITSASLIITDGLITGVQHETTPLEGTVWAEKDGILHASTEVLASATCTLANDLAATLGYEVRVQPVSATHVSAASLFLISDEFGLVPIQTTGEAPATTKLQECFAKLW